MNRSQLVFIVGGLALSLAGGGCQPAAPVTNAPVVQPATSTEPAFSFTTKKGEKDRIRLTLPAPGGKAGMPMLLAGEARGWYFEASFPVIVLNQFGVKIASGIAEADGDWMTEDWVPFTGELDYPAQPAGSKGTIVLQKDNPSGLPEHDDSIEIPIIF